jgi:hypothetical protein
VSANGLDRDWWTAALPGERPSGTAQPNTTRPLDAEHRWCQPERMGVEPNARRDQPRRRRDRTLGAEAPPNHRRARPRPRRSGRERGGQSVQSSSVTRRQSGAARGAATGRPRPGARRRTGPRGRGHAAQRPGRHPPAGPSRCRRSTRDGGPIGAEPERRATAIRARQDTHAPNTHSLKDRHQHPARPGKTFKRMRSKRTSPPITRPASRDTRSR